MHRISQIRWPTKRNTRLIVDYQKSFGNKLLDITGRKYLDMFGSIASLPLGYNHPKLVTLAHETAQKNWGALIHKPAQGLFPSADFITLTDNIINKSRLPHTSFYSMATGSEANENAIKLAYDKRSRVLSNPSTAKIISLNHGFHGRTFGALSATNTNARYKIGLPLFDWIKFDLNFTINEFYRVLCREHVAACILEPIQAEGGDRHYDPALFREIREILADTQIPLIVDEVQTGLGATGKMWAHQHWDLEQYGLPPPDFVTVSKKTQQAGIFLFEEDIPQDPLKIFNTWLGNPWDLAKFNTILDVIVDEQLLERVQKVGELLIKELLEIPEITNVRGVGTFIAFDVPDNRKLMYKLQDIGVIVGTCGDSIRLRPSLILSEQEAIEFIEILRLALSCQKSY